MIEPQPFRDPSSSIRQLSDDHGLKVGSHSTRISSTAPTCGGVRGLVPVTGPERAANTAEVVTGGPISNRDGVDLPGTSLNLSQLTEKDRVDLASGLDLGFDWVALSFVEKHSDVIQARGIIADRAGIMSKIDKPQALERIDNIIRLGKAATFQRHGRSVSSRRSPLCADRWPSCARCRSR
jgi:hypothetical protein